MPTPLNKTQPEFRQNGGNIIYLDHTNDFEMYSSRSEGAIQGYGYEFHASE
jgi:rhamnogalacturonan hydrolase